MTAEEIMPTSRDGTNLSDPRERCCEVGEFGPPYGSDVGLEGVVHVELLLVAWRKRVVRGGGGRGGRRDRSPLDEDDGKLWRRHTG